MFKLASAYVLTMAMAVAVSAPLEAGHAGHERGYHRTSHNTHVGVAHGFRHDRKHFRHDRKHFRHRARFHPHHSYGHRVVRPLPPAVFHHGPVRPLAGSVYLHGRQPGRGGVSLWFGF